MVHDIFEVYNVNAGASSGPGIAAASQTTVQYGGGIDLTEYEGNFGWKISAGTFGGGATLDAQIQDSADNSSFANLSTPVAIPQMTSAGETVLKAKVRALLPRRYVRIAVTPAVGAVVFSATFIGKKRNP